MKPTWISWFSVKADKLTRIGNLPTNSGIKPYAIRSLLSTCKITILKNVKIQVESSWVSKSCYPYKICLMKLTVSNNDDATAASVTLPVLMFARIGAPNPIEESWRLKRNEKLLVTYRNTRDPIILISLLLNFQDLCNLSEIVFSKSTKAPPQMKSIFFVSICEETQIAHQL